jgi:nucleoside-diphosphate-sugar epimerase
MKIKDKKIFITGGAGFIGATLISRLIKDNKIVVYDTLQRNSIKDTNFIDHPNLKIVQGDILDIEKLNPAIADSEIVIHLAAIAGVDTVIKSPIKTMTVNLIGTYNVLKAAETLDNIERFIYFSTSEVFGAHAYKVDELHETVQGAVGEARWTYAVSKLAGEHFVHSYFHELNMPVVIMRPFNIYGPGQIGEGAIHNFVTRALADKDLIIYGDGSQIRAWCYVEDLVDGLLLCLENDKAIGNAFNIGNPTSTVTIYDLAKRTINLAKSKSNIIFKVSNNVDIEIRVPNIDKSRKILEYEPKTDLDEGLLRTIAWYREEMKR